MAEPVQVSPWALLERLEAELPPLDGSSGDSSAPLLLAALALLVAEAEQQAALGAQVTRAIRQGKGRAAAERRSQLARDESLSSERARRARIVCEYLRDVHDLPRERVEAEARRLRGGGGLMRSSEGLAA